MSGLVVGELSVDPPLGVDPVGQMLLRIHRTNISNIQDGTY